jgi:coenzyme F420-0:L-glutamate ligase/coenzyme F420-1:gamma-L-glutamate ligase
LIVVHPLSGIGEIEPKSDLAQQLIDSLRKNDIELQSDDILVVTQKILSKAEGRFVALCEVVPSEEALRLAEITCKDARLVEMVLRESVEVVRAAPNVLITRHRLGFVMANGGIDRSNLGKGRGEHVLLLPEDPDRAASALRQDLADRAGVAPGIVISDSFGRPWRLGVTAVAIGAAGIAALVDRRGEYDRDGRALEVTQVAFGDMLATASGLVTGEGAEGIPAALIRGVRVNAPHRPAATLIRSLKEDLFR